MAPSQPWSAAGPEKPMTTVSPLASFSSDVVPWSTTSSSPSGEPAVQPARSAMAVMRGQARAEGPVTRSAC